MKKIEVIIRTFELEEVKESLCSSGVRGMTVTEAKGFHPQEARTGFYRGAAYTLDLLPTVKLEIVVHDEQVGRVVDAIRDVARTGHIRDGKLSVLPVDEVIHIRTGQRDRSAISSDAKEYATYRQPAPLARPTERGMEVHAPR